MAGYDRGKDVNQISDHGLDSDALDHVKKEGLVLVPSDQVIAAPARPNGKQGVHGGLGEVAAPVLFESICRGRALGEASARGRNPSALAGAFVSVIAASARRTRRGRGANFGQEKAALDAARKAGRAYCVSKQAGDVSSGEPPLAADTLAHISRPGGGNESRRQERTIRPVNLCLCSPSRERIGRRGLPAVGAGLVHRVNWARVLGRWLL
jgi:hypothetical protein